MGSKLKNCRKIRLTLEIVQLNLALPKNEGPVVNSLRIAAGFSFSAKFAVNCTGRWRAYQAVGLVAAVRAVGFGAVRMRPAHPHELVAANGDAQLRANRDRPPR